MASLGDLRAAAIATNGSGVQTDREAVRPGSATCKWGLPVKRCSCRRDASSTSGARGSEFRPHKKSAVNYVMLVKAAEKQHQPTTRDDDTGTRRPALRDSHGGCTRGFSFWCHRWRIFSSEFKSVAKTTANTNNLFRNSIASGYDLQSLDFLGSCQQQVSFFWKPLTSFFILAKLKQYLF